MAFVNGIRTNYYGVRWRPDGTYITTKWVVFLFIPLFPQNSVRILLASLPKETGETRRQMAIQSVPLDLWMVMRVYLIEICFVAIAWSLLRLTHIG